ncbi:mannose-P-dolichol utilization defect 1 protein homolog [Coccinella septempunctata]|uniref:mannose-P-dolichol utilization defect 1 protein homolog n=1 Tax=Coccinella septempunctata TaxID=41139 RepID=UPI001D070B7E|nr:mannose-P-dolichol utilization defect 1 protein homolog [Coccinella septempunctata]
MENMNPSERVYHDLKELALLLFSPQCFDTYFVDKNFLDKPCFLATLSTVLGVGIVLGSIFVKLPQVLKIYNAKTAKGISLATVTLDQIVLTLYSTYNYLKEFPMSAWADTAFLSIQTLAIAFLLLYYDGSPSKAYIYLVTYFIISGILESGLVPIDIIWALQGINIPLLLIGRVIQVHANYKNQSTGQLSAITCALLFFGSLARIFTSVQDTGDTMVILTNVASFLANLVIIIQILYYWKSEEKVKKQD